MRALCLLLLLLSERLSAQVLCGTANENNSVTLTAPAGHTFTSIEFASYGTPTGACGAFAVSACHAATSNSVVSSALLGHNTATIAATNGVFGDPCVGTVKRLYIQARYSATVPLTLLAFTARQTSEGNILLEWRSANEINSSHFVVERARDGLSFVVVGSINAGGEDYTFVDFARGIVYYRLKMVDNDGKFTYSKIVRVSNSNNALHVVAFPNPATHQLSVSSDKHREVIIADVNGRQMKRLMLTPGIQQVDIRYFSPGMYFIKTESGAIRFFKR